jgi:hypothetical protein
MSISFESPEIQLQKLRERLRLMSDEELIKFGKTVRTLSAPRVGVVNDPWPAQLRESVHRMEAEASKGAVMDGG